MVNKLFGPLHMDGSCTDPTSMDLASPPSVQYDTDGPTVKAAFGNVAGTYHAVCFGGWDHGLLWALQRPLGGLWRDARTGVQACRVFGVDTGSTQKIESH